MEVSNCFNRLVPPASHRSVAVVAGQVMKVAEGAFVFHGCRVFFAGGGFGVAFCLRRAHGAGHAFCGVFDCEGFVVFAVGASVDQAEEAVVAAGAEVLDEDHWK